MRRDSDRFTGTGCVPKVRLSPLSQLRSAITGKIGSAVTIRQTQVCIGVVVATSHLIYPQAVGGDIGCGMLAVAVDVEASVLKNPKTAAQLLNEIGRAVPSRRRNRNAVIPQPAEVTSDPLSHARLEAIRQREGEIEFATLGSGNHFLEM